MDSRAALQPHPHTLLLWFPPTVFWVLHTLVQRIWPSWVAGCEPEGFAQDISLYVTVLIAIPPAIIAFPEMLKGFAFYLHFVTTLTIRCLSGFSGTTTVTSSCAFFFNSNPPLKPLFWWFLIELWVWEWTYLGTYSDTYYLSLGVFPHFHVWVCTNNSSGFKVNGRRETKDRACLYIRTGCRRGLQSL